jgi:hypothetical protein
MQSRAERLLKIKRQLSILDGLLAIADKLYEQKTKRGELARERDAIRRQMGASERREYERLAGEPWPTR